MRILIYITISLYLIGCTKRPEISFNLDHLKKRNAFFSSTQGVNYPIAKVLDSLDKMYNFVESLPSEIGHPVWQKVVNNRQKAKSKYARGVIKDYDDNYIIPLTSDGISLSGILFALKKEGEYKFYCYTNEYLYKIIFKSDYSIRQKEKLLALFMYMTNLCFGVKEFINIPSDIFYSDKNKVYDESLNSIFIKDVTEKLEDTSKIESLKFVTICIRRFSVLKCTCFEKTPQGCDWCDECTIEDCFSEWIEPSGGGGTDDNPPLPPVDPVGGSSGGGFPPSPPCPGVAWYQRFSLVKSENCNLDSLPSQTYDSTILNLLKQDLEIFKSTRDSIWQLALYHNWEWGFLLGVKDNFNGIVNLKTDSMENEIAFSNRYYTIFNIYADYHTHQDSRSNDRHLHDPGDLLAGNIKMRNVPYARSYVDCGDTIYVVVNERVDKINDFARRINLREENERWRTILYNSSNRRGDGRRLLLELLKTTEYSGLGVYKSTNSTFTNFTKIN